MRSKNLKICEKMSNDLYFKTEGVKFCGLFTERECREG